MSLFGAKKTSTFQKAMERMDKMMMAESSGTEQAVSAVSSSHVGKQLEILGRGLPNPDGTAMTSAGAWEDCEQEGQGEHPSRVMEAVLGSQPCDEYGVKVHTISSYDDSSLSRPPMTSYGGSEISFRSRTPRERVESPLPTTNYEGSLLGLPPSALPQDLFSTRRASAGIIAQRYIQSEENVSQHAEKADGMEETWKVCTPIPRTFEISDSSDDAMTEVEWRDESPYMMPTKKGKKCNKGKGVKRPETPERPIPNMLQTPSRRKLEADWAKPAKEVTNKNKETNLEAFVGEYLRN